MKITFLWLNLIFCTIVFGQGSEQNITKVILTNGHEISGVLVAYHTDSLVSLLVGENTMEFPMSKVKKLETFVDLPTAYRFGDKKWWNRISLSVLHSDVNDGYSLSNTFYYNPHRLINIGAGIGLANYRHDSRFNLIPIHLEIISYLLENNYSPYLAMQGGYALAIKKADAGFTEADGGRVLAGRLGMRFSDHGVVFDLFAGIKYQKSAYQYRHWDILYHDNIDYKRLEVGIGIMF